MSDILERILAAKADEDRRRQARAPFDGSRGRGARARRRRAISSAALRAKIAARTPAVIAEIKKASPSKGVLREDFDPPAIARATSAAARPACRCSPTAVLPGRARYLVAARAACALPVLRKDFIVDAYQVAESRALGADASC